jgi:septum site-determining protein MinC
LKIGQLLSTRKRQASEKVERVTIKGTSEGLIISLGAGPLHKVLEEMEARLRAKASFFRGGRVALRVGERPLSAAQLRSIGDLLETLGVSLWAIEGDHPTTQTAAQELGLEIKMQSALPKADSPVEGHAREEMSGLVLRRTLRSGQAINHAGHIVLIGDVNPGAEVVAGGDIIIWGKLRGTAHAGAMGDEGALICALQLAPSQLRIGSLIARPPDRGRPPKTPEVARVQEERIVVERWDKMG